MPERLRAASHRGEYETLEGKLLAGRADILLLVVGGRASNAPAVQHEMPHSMFSTMTSEAVKSSSRLKHATA